MNQKTLSPLEQEIMNIVWDLKTCSVREVLACVTKDKVLAYTTVGTILTRLYEKGLLARKEKGSIVRYTPKITKETYGKTVATSFFTKFFQSFGDSAIASFAESVDTLPKHKKEYLLRLLSKHENK